MVTILSKMVVSIFVSGVLIAPSVAQDRLMRFHSIDYKGFITVQDSTGFIWMIGEGGVDRYDGTRIIQYRYDEADSTSIPSDAVEPLIASRTGGVWIGTLGEGIALFIPETESFRRYLPGEYVMRLFEASDGHVWAGTREGVLRLNPEDGTFERFPVEGRWIQVFYEDSQANVWTGITGETSESSALLYRYEPGADSLKPYLRLNSPEWEKIGSPFGLTRIHERSDTTMLFASAGILEFDRTTEVFAQDSPLARMVDAPVTRFFKDSEARLWVNTLGGMYRQDAPDSASIKLFNGSAMLAITEDQNGFIWAGTGRGNVLRIDPADNSYDYWRYDRTDPDSPPEGAIQYLMLDQSGAMWVNSGTWFDPTGPDFRGIPLTEDDGGLTSGPITALTRSPDGALWIGTFQTGLYRRDPATGAITSFRFDPENENSLSTDRIWSLTSTDDGVVWVGTNGGGVNRLDPETGIVHRFSRETGHVATGSISEIKAISEGRLQVTDVDAIYEMDLRTGEWENVGDRIVNGPSVAGRNIFTSAFDAEGRLWLATQDQGVFRISADGSESVQFYHNSGDEGGLGTNDTRRIFVDRAGQIWIGANTGLFHVLPSADDTLVVRRYGPEHGLPTTGVLDILDDASGRIWLTTTESIAMLTPETDQITVYDESNGLPTWIGRFRENSIYEDPVSGEILVGAQGGVLSFHPERMALVSDPPKVIVGSVNRYNTDNEAGTPIAERGMWTRKDITLGYKDNILEVDLVALSYRYPDRNQYAYRLEGFSDTWFELGSRTTVTLTNLDAGSYSMWIRAANAQGQWSEDTRALSIIQKPPWWRTTLAYIIYAFLFIGAIGGAWEGQRRRLVSRERTQAQIREAELQAETASAKAGEAEAAARALQAENERKEVELEKARELEEAFRALEAAHYRLQETQDQLIHSEKMASLGQLTAGIAHEIKNPLNFVKNFAELNTELVEELAEELAETKLPEDVRALVDDILGNARQIVKHGGRADAIVASMMEHAVAGSGEKVAINLNESVKEFANLSYHAWQAQHGEIQIRLVFELTEDLPLTAAEPQELGRAWLNIFNNAFWAVGEKEAAAGSDYTPTVTVQSSHSGDNITIRIEDNGPGIAAGDLAKVFDPFYTTKPTGHGNTGLGLSLTHDIISKGHRGTLTVENAPGGGASFVATLPAVVAESS